MGKELNKGMKNQLLEHVSLTEVDAEAVLLDLNTGSYYGLNHTGAQLMRVLDHAGSVSDAVQELAEKYQTDVSTLEADISQLLDQLLKEKLTTARDTQ
ncbi:MAG: hypothetical protein ACI9SX_001677 [Pseudoalteromonas tetraodonis]